MTTIYFKLPDGNVIVGDMDLRGIIGETGDSAYLVAVANGFVGTAEEWLLSLVGAAGADGSSATLAQVLASGADANGVSITGLRNLTGGPGLGVIIRPASAGVGVMGPQLQLSGGIGDSQALSAATVYLAGGSDTGEGGVLLLSGGWGKAGQPGGGVSFVGGFGDYGGTTVLGGSIAVQPGAADGSGGSVLAVGSTGAADKPGGDVGLQGGSGDDGNDDFAEVIVKAGDGLGQKGRVVIKTNGSTGAAGQVLKATGDGYAVWSDP